MHRDWLGHSGWAASDTGATKAGATIDELRGRPIGIVAGVLVLLGRLASFRGVGPSVPYRCYSHVRAGSVAALQDAPPLGKTLRNSNGSRAYRQS